MLNEEKQEIEELVDSAKEYIETRSEISKLKAIDKGSKMAGSMASGIILMVLFFAILAFVSIAVAFALSEWIGRAFSGFLIVAGFYLLVFVLLALNKERWIENPVTNSIIRNFFKDHEKD
ncbi:MAG: phage holin family protein [Bacteroidetes bacterium]|nr:phage holin family protein [Bacteroidota bacterium]MBL0066404.1 phage holin family protein [Bacteroidota bacterium]MBL0138943.1 phage holin family protein [Bacteroidota bacterium]